jgi:hypothetical protein
MFRLDQRAESEWGEALDQVCGGLPMPPRSFFHALLRDESETLRQAINRRDGSRVVVDAFAAVVPIEEADVQKPTLYRGGPCCDGLESTVGETDGREAGGARKAFLAAAIGGVDSPAIEF